MKRKIEYSVPTYALVEFTEMLVSRGLRATLVGANEDGDILLEVEYEKEETSDVDEMEDFLENLREEEEEEEEEETE
ncbi:MAG: hypothetical protein NT084_13335 [Bacteroidetes bacterium]|nr:hypothetical protein [Bacteroidota bacterium]